MLKKGKGNLTIVRKSSGEQIRKHHKVFSSISMNPHLDYGIGLLSCHCKANKKKMCEERKKRLRGIEKLPLPGETEEFRALQFGIYATDRLKQRILNHELHWETTKQIIFPGFDVLNSGTPNSPNGEITRQNQQY